MIALGIYSDDIISSGRLSSGNNTEGEEKVLDPYNNQGESALIIIGLVKTPAKTTARQL
jgi:hypothetical protein